MSVCAEGRRQQASLPREEKEALSFPTSPRGPSTERDSLLRTDTDRPKTTTLQGEGISPCQHTYTRKREGEMEGGCGRQFSWLCEDESSIHHPSFFFSSAPLGELFSMFVRTRRRRLICLSGSFLPFSPLYQACSLLVVHKCSVPRRLCVCLYRQLFSQQSLKFTPMSRSILLLPKAFNRLTKPFP